MAFADGDAGEIKGSARSIRGFHIRDALEAIAAKHPGMLVRFGGHAMAAGLTLKAEWLEGFRAAFVAEAERMLDETDLEDCIYSDGGLAEQDFHLTLADQLRFAAPWGQGFTDPLFDGRFRVVQQRIVGEHHLKLSVQPQGSRRLVDAIWFNVSDHMPLPELEEVELVYKLDANEFRGVRSVQLIVQHLQLPH